MNNTCKIAYTVSDYTKDKKIMSLCRSFKISTKKIELSDLHKPLGSLFGMNNQTNKKENWIIDKQVPDCMFFCGFSDDELDKFLKEYKNRNIEKIELKAVLTIHNFNWSISYLLNELQKENQMINGQNK